MAECPGPGFVPALVMWRRGFWSAAKRARSATLRRRSVMVCGAVRVSARVRRRVGIIRCRPGVSVLGRGVRVWVGGCVPVGEQQAA